MAKGNEYLRYDPVTRHFVPTERMITEKCGIDLRARLSDSASVNVDAVMENFLQTVSDMIYTYIHGYNINTMRQDKLIEDVPSVFPIMERAMMHQAVYVMSVGNLYLSTDAKERAAAISPLAESALAMIVPELGVSILYSGGI